MSKSKAHNTDDLDSRASENTSSEDSKAGQVDTRSPLEIAVSERDEYLAHWQRATADYQNLRRRILEDIDAAVHRETSSLMFEMLTVLDYLDMALATPCESPDSKNLQMGVQLTRTSLWNALERQGVKLIAAEGLFNPALHQAMATVTTEEVEPGTIMGVVRAGFQKQDFVLRHAQVKVAALPSPDAQA